MAFAVLGGGPILAISDLAASIAFYTEGLGFTIDARFDDPPFAILSNGPVGLCLAEQGHPAVDLPGHVMTAPSDPTKMAVVLVLRVDDVHAVHAELVSRGVPFASDVWSPPWGGGRCFARDPDGFLVEIETLS